MIYIWSSFTSSIENVMQLILSKIGHQVYNFSNLFHVSQVLELCNSSQISIVCDGL